MSARGGLTVSDDIRQKVLAITGQPRFEMKTGVTFDGQAYIQLVTPPAGRGQARGKYLIVAPTLSDCFYVLSEVTQ